MFVFQGGKTANPDDALVIWKKSFDTFYSESNLFHTYCQFSLHPFLIGRPGRIEVLSELIEYVKRHEGVWFATTDEIARRVLECASLTPSVGATLRLGEPSHELSFSPTVNSTFY